jgi:hypothetical protein
MVVILVGCLRKQESVRKKKKPKRANRFGLFLAVQKGVIFPFLNSLEAMSVVATSFKSLVVSGLLTTRRVANGAIATFFRCFLNTLH